MNNLHPIHPLVPFVLLISMLMGSTRTLHAGGPWVLGKGQADLTLGFSRKVATDRWAHFHLDVNGTPKNYTDDLDSFALVSSPDSVRVDGKVHDFRYYYFQGSWGFAKNFELYWNINWLDGRESQPRDPKTNKLYTYYDDEGNMIKGENGTYHYAVWEHNTGFSDSWLGLKYQFKHDAWPMTVEVNCRFPDLYQQYGPDYTHYVYQYLLYTQVDGDTSHTERDTLVESSNEWRGLNGRDFGILLHTGHSFFKDGALYGQAFAGYTWRVNNHFERTAYADQVVFGLNGGYNLRLSEKINLLPKLWLDYTGGIGNGGQPATEDRFYSPYKNHNFNNSKVFRGYLSADLMYDNRFVLQAGLGQWLWGRGAVKYTEMFIQLTCMLGRTKS